MVEKQLWVTFEGPGIAEHGVPVTALVATLDGVQDATRLMVEHLGGRQRGPGQPVKWVRDQSRLRLATTHLGSFVAAIGLGAAAGGQSTLPGELRAAGNRGPKDLGWK